MNQFDPKIHDENPAMDAAFMAGMEPARRGRPKVEVKIRLDAETVEHMRKSGPSWQARVNALLSRMVAAGQI